MRKTCIDMVHALAKRDERVVFIGSDLSPGLLAEMKQEFPDRHYMEGVAEANFVGMAAGMAMDGLIPYINTIATFLTRRCYEQVAVDLCLHNLPVRLIANGGGLVYAPLGPTHVAIEDLAIMRALPNMTVVAPADAEEMRRFMEISLDWPGPIYIRLGKGGDPIVTREADGFEIGKAYHLREANGGRFGPVLIVSTGVMTGRALSAAEELAGDGIACDVLHLPTIKPLDGSALQRLAAKARLLVTVEEGTVVGGLGSAVVELLAERLEGGLPPVRRLGVPDVFLHDYGDQDWLMERCGLQPHQIAKTIADAVNVLAAA
ncbi:MAG: transketolase C-terminal domain-containing protein [Alphaproteobacteria bacterium]|jgi:transketolase|nr:transketolase C-terminal domain-containing protein [Alphaproteobacteria bacterium]